jgi:hypothetical protein
VNEKGLFLTGACLVDGHQHPGAPPSSASAIEGTTEDSVVPLIMRISE